jgi:hypothetical protein
LAHLSPEAGQPEISPIPASHRAYIQQVAALPWVAPHLASYVGVRWGMVEIAPLLAFQLTVSTDRSQFHCGNFAASPTMDQILWCCLPVAQPQEPVRVIGTQQSMMITARSLNVRLIECGQLQPNVIGIAFGVAIPLMHVVNCNGRYLLQNGFHRAHALGQCEVTHVPCLIRVATSAADAGIRTDGVTFTETLLYSANPPTMGHFSRGRAHAVQLRPFTKAIHVSWADYAVPERDP